jgi:hypothetical protein
LTNAGIGTLTEAMVSMRKQIDDLRKDVHGLASEIISMPRSTIQRLRWSGSKASSVTPVISLWISSMASTMSVRRGIGEGEAFRTLAPPRPRCAPAELGAGCAAS